MGIFHTADPDDVKAGKVTDVYFSRTMQILAARGINKRVRAEFIVKSFPDNRGWGILAGIEEAARLLEGIDVNVRAMAEGEVFHTLEPVMEIEGCYGVFGHYETALLGLICQASGVATGAARCKRLAGDRPVISFGARRMHPVLAPMIERNAYIGGCDGVSVIKSAELIGSDPMGTMPHALVLLFGDTVEAARAFDEVIDKAARRTVLIDTFNDEKFEAVRVAEAMGDALYAVRLDTPASRRGSFFRILEEVRWELDLRGFKGVKLFVSGGIREEDIPILNPVVDAYGIGTLISNAPVLDFSMDIVEIDGQPAAKRGKWSGSKTVLRCPSCGNDIIIPLKGKRDKCGCGGERYELLSPLLEGGRLARDLPPAKEIRDKVLNSLADMES